MKYGITDSTLAPRFPGMETFYYMLMQLYCVAKIEENKIAIFI